jgi:hypothetical protein
VEEDLLIGDVAGRFLIGAPTRSMEDAVAGKHKSSLRLFVVCLFSGISTSLKLFENECLRQLCPLPYRAQFRHCCAHITIVSVLSISSWSHVSLASMM